MPIQEHGVPAELIKSIRFGVLTGAQKSAQKGAMVAHIQAYNAWKVAQRKCERMKENPFGATGLTAGKFVTLWCEHQSVDSDHMVKSLRSVKNTLEMIDRVARKYDIKSVRSTSHLRELDKAPTSGKVTDVSMPMEIAQRVLKGKNKSELKAIIKVAEAMLKQK